MAELIILILAFTTVYFAWPTIKRRKWNRQWKTFYESEDSGIQHVYTDNTGSRWYQFTAKIALPAQRSIAAEVAARHAELCMSPKVFVDYLVKMKELCNSGNLVGVAGLLSRMEERATRAAERETLLDLANCYFLLEGENPKQITQSWSKRKREIWDKDQDCEAFFLICANALIRSSSELSDTDLLLCLMKQKNKQRNQG